MTGAAGHLLSVADLGADGIEEVLRAERSGTSPETFAVTIRVVG